MADPANRDASPAARRHGVYLAACLATLLYVSLAQHFLPSGDRWGWRAGAFTELAAALPEAWGAWRGAAGALAASRLLEQRMDAFERQLEEDSHLRQLALPAVQWALLAAGGVGNESVLAGRDGWLLLAGGFDYLVGPPFLDPAILQRRRRQAPAWQVQIAADPRPAILDFHRQLAERGIELIFLPAPSKPMVHPESMAAGFDAPDRRHGEIDSGLQNPSFGPLRETLEAAGVVVFDPTATLLRHRLESGGEAYLRTDSHWSPQGVEAVARELADRIDRMALAWSGPQVSWRRQADSVDGIGDLERTLLLPGWQQLFGPQRVELQRVLSRQGRPWQPDPRAEILLLGDSFTNVFSDPNLGWGRAAGLAEQLSFHLRRPLDRIAINAGGAAATRRRLAEAKGAGRDRLAGKRLVIWQLAVRELAIGEWDLVEVGSGSPG